MYIYCLLKVYIWSVNNMVQPMMTRERFATMLVLSCILRPSMTSAQPNFSQKCTFSLNDISGISYLIVLCMVGTIQRFPLLMPGIQYSSCV